MRLPAEWEKQSGVQLTWPHCDTEWYDLENVLRCYVEIAYNILRYEPLMIACRDISEAKADIARINDHLAHIVDYTIHWFAMLKEKYGKRYPRLI